MCSSSQLTKHIYMLDNLALSLPHHGRKPWLWRMWRLASGKMLTIRDLSAHVGSATGTKNRLNLCLMWIHKRKMRHLKQTTYKDERVFTTAAILPLQQHPTFPHFSHLHSLDWSFKDPLELLLLESAGSGGRGGGNHKCHLSKIASYLCSHHVTRQGQSARIHRVLLPLSPPPPNQANCRAMWHHFRVHLA